MALFDNVLKVYKALSIINVGTTVSLEIDLDIPRQFLVKIHKVEMGVGRLGEDFEGISADKLARILGALVKDPDDTTTLTIPEETLSHDVICDIEAEVVLVAGTAGDVVAKIDQFIKTYNFSSEGLDVFTARNMRWNIAGGGTDVADLTEAIAWCTLHYTLEKVTNDQILQILDIL